VATEGDRMLQQTGRLTRFPTGTGPARLEVK
jgi:hypothetical protein